LERNVAVGNRSGFGSRFGFAIAAARARRAGWFKPWNDFAGHTLPLTLFDQAEVILLAGRYEAHGHTAFTGAPRSTYAMYIVSR